MVFDIFMKNSPKIIVIGGVAAGPAAAARAARMNPKAQVVLFEQGRHISYGTCDLPFFIQGIIPQADDLVMFTPDQFQREKRVNVFCEQQVDAIYPIQKKIRIRDLSCGASVEDSYDRLILATGSKVRFPAIFPTNAPNLFTLKTLSDARRIKDFITANRPRTALVLGGGYIALEMAEVFVKLGISVTILHQPEKPMPGFERDTQEKILLKLADNHIQYLGQVDILGLAQDWFSKRITMLNTNQGQFYADLVLVAWGFEPNVELARQTGIWLGQTGAIAVDEKMRTSIDHIFACGDCIELKHRVTGRPIYAPAAVHAAKTARVAADNAVGQLAVYKGTVNTLGLTFFDGELARTGLDSAAALSHGFQPISATVTGSNQTPILPGADNLQVTLVADRLTQQLLGANIIGGTGSGLRINPLAVMIQQKMTIPDVLQSDLLYTPALAPLWDPILIAASQVQRKLGP